jgi:hypothetical protein
MMQVPDAVSKRRTPKSSNQKCETMQSESQLKERRRQGRPMCPGRSSGTKAEARGGSSRLQMATKPRLIRHTHKAALAVAAEAAERIP